MRRRVDFFGSSANVELEAMQRDGALLRATSGNAAAIFELAAPLAAGWHRIRLDLAGPSKLRATIAFDFGAGFDQSFSASLARNANPAVRRAVVKLPYPARRIRLEFDDAEPGIVIGGLMVASMPGLAVAMFLVGEALRRSAADPLAFLRRAPHYAAALRKPYFHRSSDGRSAARGDAYARWIERCDYDEVRDSAALEAAILALPERPLVSLVLAPGAYGEGLEPTLRSVLAQAYGGWELIVPNDGTLPGAIEAVSGLAAGDARVRTVPAPAGATLVPDVLGANGSWIARIGGGDVLAPQALAEMMLAAAGDPGTRMLYADEDRLDHRGRRRDPWFKPDFSRELFRSQDYLGPLVLLRADDVREAGGWLRGPAGAYDLALRIFERIGVGAVRHVPKVLCHRTMMSVRPGEGEEERAAGERRALECHLARLGMSATVETLPNTPWRRIVFNVPQPQPPVSLIIPTRDRADLLRACIASVLTRTDYAELEIIVVDNGSTEAAALALFAELARSDRVRVLRDDRQFNYSAINNRAAGAARGSLLCLLNNDVEAMSPGWLAEMVSWAVQPDIGCVGAKLLYPDGRVQHAGIVAGSGTVADHAFRGLGRDEPGYFGRAGLVSNVTAVTAACLVVRKAVYDVVGGLDEGLPVAFNDVDFCLKVREAGYLNVWTPFAELCHHESFSRGAEDNPAKFLRHQREIRLMRERWGERVTRDPYYSPNLSARRADFTIGEGERK